jgi:hypothetical protein
MVLIGLIIILFGIFISVFSVLGLLIQKEIEEDKILSKFRIFPKEYYYMRNIIGLIIGLFLLLLGTLTIITNLIK